MMMIEDIRVKLASGLYDKRAVWTNIKEKISWESFSDIANYVVHPDIRSDLQVRIEEVEVAKGIYSIYQANLQKEFEKAEAAELLGNKHYPFKEHKDILDGLLEVSIGKLTTVSIDELRKFYLN